MQTPCSTIAVVVVLLLGASSCDLSQHNPAASGNLTLHGRTVHYDYEDHNIQHVIVFDSLIETKGEGVFSGNELTFQTTNDKKFSMRRRSPKTITINQQEYDLTKGVVFLITLKGANARCIQRPILFAPNERDSPEIAAYVNRKLMDAAKKDDELAKHINPQ